MGVHTPQGGRRGKRAGFQAYCLLIAVWLEAEPLASLSLVSQPALLPSLSEGQVWPTGGMTPDPLPRLHVEGRCGSRRSRPDPGQRAGI